MGTLAGRTLGDLSRFLPGTLVEWAGRISRDAQRPPRETHVGALMVTDVSGFTRLTAKLSRDSGQAGAERIGIVLNGFLSKLVGTVDKHSGAILSFEGDSVLAGWKSKQDPAALAAAVWSSCNCALSLQREFGQTVVEGDTLTLRSGIALGTVYLVHLLSETADPRVILTGPAINEVCHCAALADSGETLLSLNAWSHVSEHAKGNALASGAVELLDMGQTPLAPYTHANGPLAFDGSELKSYLPAVVRSRLSSPFSRWLAELRTVTTSFVRITGNNLFNDLTLLERAFENLQAKITRFRGDLLRITVVEGGLQALSVYGLPGNAHKDDPRRAILAALELQDEVCKLGLHVSTGIATGDAFCGAIGTEQRAEYTVLGESVNRAARLAALAAGRTLTDDVTAQESSSFISFQGPWPMQVPGIRAPVLTYVALQPVRESTFAGHGGIVGREEELSRLYTLVDQRDRTKPQVTVIVGESGIGKSTLAEALTKHCRAVGLAVYDGFADDIEQNTPYFAFRRVIRQLLRVERNQGRNEAHAQIVARLAARPEQVRLIPLLSDILGVDFEESSSTGEMPRSVRSENLRRLVRDLMLDALLVQPSVLIVEDIHWLDAASASVLTDLVRSGKPITVVTTSRTELPRGHPLQQIVDVDYLTLNALDEARTAELVKSCLRRTNIPSSLQQAIWQRTGGNPFFVGEICRVIERQRPGVDTSRVPVADGLDEDSLVALPQSARAAVLNRTDSLLPDDQFILKIASAMAPAFTVSEIEAVDLVGNAGINVVKSVASLVGANLIREVPVGSGRYAFSHRIIRDVVYGGMLSEQKQDVHAAIAKAIERDSQRSEAESLPLILGQWERAGSRDKVVEYLDRVAELRLRQFEYASAITHSEAFFKTAKEQSISVPPFRRAAAHFVLGEAQINLGRFEAARASFESGLRILKLPMPRTRLGLALNMAGQVGRHLIRSARSRKARATFNQKTRDSVPVNEAILKGARAYEDLTNIYYFQGDKVRLLYATLRATNLAEAVPKLSPVLALNYASLGAICGVIPLRKRATYYLNLASELSDELAIPTVTIRVNLLAALYKISIGEWQSARFLLEPALDQALRLGDSRRWSELAVSLETIISPWLLNPSYGGEVLWGSLVERICQTARASGDVQVFGSGLAGAIRGFRTLRADARARSYLDELADLMRTRSSSLEPIHRLEAAAFLADAALENDDIAAWQHWIEQAAQWIKGVNPGVKSRTLPALCAAFSAAIKRPPQEQAISGFKTADRLAHVSAANLRRFAKIYPIGRPRAALFSGDMEAHSGNTGQAEKHWRQALMCACQLGMPADARAALARLQSAGVTLAESESLAVKKLDAIVAVGDPALGKTVERAAAVLRIGATDARA